MEKKKISTSFSASMSDCFTTETEKFLRAKLKVFYIGETADKRKFSEEMAEKLIKTLPYTPIVSYYDECKDDFVGHACEQAIYGIVDPKGEISFIEEDGVKWAVCDVVLYTERPDMVGTIAQKIVGKQQSLELDPATVKYNIKFDSKRNIKSIEFTDGEFIGVSVLGDSQNPAFTGSAFFEINEDFENKMNLLKNYCTRSEESVEEEIIEKVTLTSFLERSWGDKSRILQEIGWTLDRFVQAIYDDYVILGDYWTGQLYKHTYSINEDGSCFLGDGIPVLIQYVEVPQEIEKENETEDLDPQYKKDEEEEKKTKCQEEVSEDTEVSENAEPVQEVVEDNSQQFEETIILEQESVEEIVVETNTEATEEEPAENTESVVENQEQFTVQPEIEQEDNDEEGSTESSTFDNSQEAELNAFKRKEKEAIIEKFKEYLTDQEILNYNSNIENFNKEELESNLALLCFDRVRKVEKPKVRIYRGQTEKENSAFMTEQERLEAVLKRYNN